MNDIKFVQELMKELYATGRALTMFNADTGKFSIVPKSEYFITVNRKPQEIKPEDVSFIIADKTGAVANAESKPQPKWKVNSFPYVGKNIAITGNVTNKINIGFLKAIIRKSGANVKSSVGPTTNLLVVGELTADSNKIIKAETHGVKCISLNEFLNCIGYEDRRQKPEEPAYINHARPSQRRAAEQDVGVPTYSDERMKAEELNQFSNEQMDIHMGKSAERARKFQQFIDELDGLSKLNEWRSLEKAMIELGGMVSAIETTATGRGLRKDRIEYTFNICPDGSADIFKYVNDMHNRSYHITKALLEGCKDLDGKGYLGAANWAYGDTYVRMSLERIFGKELVDLCREHIVAKL